MKYDLVDPGRVFTVGIPTNSFQLTHVMNIALGPNEQVTFTTPGGAELDVVQKPWGFYATPSLNGRLPKFGLRACIAISGEMRYVLLVEKGRETGFYEYLRGQNMRVLYWLDGKEAFTAEENR